jgi:hypothetical protein
VPIGDKHLKVTPAKFPSHRELGSELSEMLTDQALQAMDAVEYITEHLRRDNLDKKIREEWRFVAMVCLSIVMTDYGYFFLLLTGSRP